jgi:hypothetical protein
VSAHELSDFGSAAKLIREHLEQVAGPTHAAELIKGAMQSRVDAINRKEQWARKPWPRIHLSARRRERLIAGWQALKPAEQHDIAKAALNRFLEETSAKPQTAPAAASATPQTPARATISTPTAAFAPAKASSGSKPASPSGLELDALQCLHAAIFDSRGNATLDQITEDFSREGMAEIIGITPKRGARVPELWGKGATTAKAIAADFCAVLSGQAPSQQFSSGACLARKYIESKNKYPNKI